MKNLLIIDVETTGLSIEKDKIIEVGALYYNLKTKSVLHCASVLMPHYENNAAHINNISIESLKEVKTIHTYYGLTLIKQLIIDADLLIAHNAKFDKKWLENFLHLKHFVKCKKWLCTKDNIKWPLMKDKKLKTIAKFYDISYEGSHRALADCHILLSCLQKLNDFDEQLKNF